MAPSGVVMVILMVADLTLVDGVVGGALAPVEDGVEEVVSAPPQGGVVDPVHKLLQV